MNMIQFNVHTNAYLENLGKVTEVEGIVRLGGSWEQLFENCLVYVTRGGYDFAGQGLEVRTLYVCMFIMLMSI